jgi:hypothetical protein
MRDLTEKHFVAAMERKFMTVLIQANGYRGALKSALESLKQAQTEVGRK